MTAGCKGAAAVDGDVIISDSPVPFGTALVAAVEAGVGAELVSLGVRIEGRSPGEEAVEGGFASDARLTLAAAAAARF